MVFLSPCQVFNSGRDFLARNPYLCILHKKMNKMKAKEPTASYIRSTTNVPFDKTYERFGERYRKAKAFAYAHFDKEYAQSLEARNFLLDAPFPAERCETEKPIWNALSANRKQAEFVRKKRWIKCLRDGKASFYEIGRHRATNNSQLKAPCLLCLCIQIL